MRFIAKEKKTGKREREKEKKETGRQRQKLHKRRTAWHSGTIASLFDARVSHPAIDPGNLDLHNLNHY